MGVCLQNFLYSVTHCPRVQSLVLPNIVINAKIQSFYLIIRCAFFLLKNINENIRNERKS